MTQDRMNALAMLSMEKEKAYQTCTNNNTHTHASVSSSNIEQFIYKSLIFSCK